MERSGLIYEESLTGELTLVGYDASSRRHRVVVPSVVDGAPVTRIGFGAFRDCEELEAIALPETVDEIGAEAFLGCSKLLAIQLPAGLKSLGSRAFEGCESLPLIDLPVGLTRLSSRLFFGCEKLLTARIPSEVRRIDDLAFSGCSSLVEATAPASLREIGDNAFNGCSALESLTLPASVAEISPTAFFGCEKLDLTTTFLDCRHFDAFTFQELGASTDPGGLICQLTGDSAAVVGYFGTPTELRLPSTILGRKLVRIGEQAFVNCESLRRVAISEETYLIDSEAFCGCAALEEVELPPKLSAFGVSVFDSCAALRSITLPASFTTLPVSTFRGCAALERVLLPEGLRRIEDYAFCSCSALTEIETPESLEYLGEGAFAYCSELRRVRLPKNIWGIAANLFEGCESLDVEDAFRETRYLGAKRFSELGASYDDGWLFYRRGYRDMMLYGILGEPTSLEIPERIEGLPVRGMAPNTFQGSTELTTISLPDTLFTVPSEAFANCAALETIRFPSTLVEIGDRAFVGCSALTSATLPATLQRLGERAFAECESLLSVAVDGDDALSVQDGAFSGCVELERASLPGAKRLGNHVFNGCASLVEVVLSKEVKEIGVLAFFGCVNLDYESSFAGIESFGAAPMSAIGSEEEGWVLYRREGDDCTLVEAVGFPATLQPPTTLSGLTLRRVGDTAFAFNKRLRQATLPSTVDAIGVESFLGCENLREFEYIGRLEIGDRAFWECRRLERVAPKECDESELPTESNADAASESASWTSIGSHAFFGCSALSTVVLKSATKIGKSAFLETPRLQTVEFSGRVEEVGPLAFFGRFPADLRRTFDGNVGVGFLPLSDEPETRGASARSSGLFYKPTGPDGSEVAIVGSSGTPTRVTIPMAIDGKRVVAIGDFAFTCQTALETIALPSSTTRIGSYAFYGCTLLAQAKLSPLTESLGFRAFGENPALDVVATLREVRRFGAVGFASFGDSIGEGCLIYERLPDGSGSSIVGSVGEPIRLTLPSELSGAPVTAIGTKAFCGCDTLESVATPPTLRRIGALAFDECYSLAAVELAEGLVEVGVGAFQRCESLAKIAFPQSTTTIGDRVCAFCDNLEAASTPGSEAIPADAFLDVYSLRRLELAPNLQRLGNMALMKDESLDIVDAFRVCENFRYERFAELDAVGDEQGLLFRRSGDGFAVALYLGEAKEVEIPSEVDGLPVVGVDDGAFSNRYFLERVRAPETVDRIGRYAFLACPNLREVNIPAKLASVGDYAFALSPKLSFNELPATVTEVGKGVFAEESASFYDELLKEFADSELDSEWD